MIIDCPNAQYISRNLVEIAEVIIRFKELNHTYSDNLSLYLDSIGWEIFDTRRGITIFRHEFKHINRLLTQMQTFNFDLANLYNLRSRLSIGKNPTTSEVASLKRIYRLYGFDRYFFNTQQIINYLNGKFNQEQNLADCH